MKKFNKAPFKTDVKKISHDWDPFPLVCHPSSVTFAIPLLSLSATKKRKNFSEYNVSRKRILGSTSCLFITLYPTPTYLFLTIKSKKGLIVVLPWHQAIVAKKWNYMLYQTNAAQYIFKNVHLVTFLFHIIFPRYAYAQNIIISKYWEQSHFTRDKIGMINTSRQL